MTTYPWLQCWTCHTIWKEWVFSPYQKCPFTDCAGTLRPYEPPPPPAQPKKKKPAPLPILQLLDGGR